MSYRSFPRLSRSTLVNPSFCRLQGLDVGTNTLSLHDKDPCQYSHYCVWWRHWRRLRDGRLPMEARLAAYLWLVGAQGQQFRLEFDSIPCVKWLQKTLGIQRNTLVRYISDVRATGLVQPKLATASHLLFAAAIYPPISMHERQAESDVLRSRLDLIHDYYLTGRCKSKMVSALIPIVVSGENKLLAGPKTYPSLLLWTCEGRLTDFAQEMKDRMRTKRQGCNTE